MRSADYTYELDEGVVTWDLKGMARAGPGDVEELLLEMAEVSNRPRVSAAVILFPNRGSLSRDVLDVIERYNEAFEGLGVSRAALVSGDVKNLAVKSRLDVEGVEFGTFDDLDEAEIWAGRGA